MQQEAAEATEDPEISETRELPRYTLATTIEAQFASQLAIVRNISARGLGLRHPAQVRVGAALDVKIEAPENENAMLLRCRVAWSRLSRVADERGRAFYDSGLFIIDDSTRVAALMGRLIRAYGIADSDSLDAKRRTLEARARSRVAIAAVPDPQP